MVTCAGASASPQAHAQGHLDELNPPPPHLPHGIRDSSETTICLFPGTGRRDIKTQQQAAEEIPSLPSPFPTRQQMQLNNLP